MDGEDSDVTGKKDDVKARKNGDKNASSHKDKTASDALNIHGDKDADPTTDEKVELVFMRAKKERILSVPFFVKNCSKRRFNAKNI